jgi:hypothetical protein
MSMPQRTSKDWRDRARAIGPMIDAAAAADEQVTELSADVDGKIGEDLPVFEHWHPICLPHYRTGRPLLFVTECLTQN